jgi:hypothetical protein
MEGNSTTELPIIETGVVLEWSDGTESEVVSLYFNEDGVPQFRLKEYHAGESEPYRTIGVTYEDIRERISEHGVEVVEDSDPHVGEIDTLA